MTKHEGSTWLTKAIYRKALREGRVYMTAQIRTSNGITGYNLYIAEVDKHHKVTLLHVYGHSGYWSKARQCYHVTCWGTSRPLEVILSVGYNLGLKFEDIKQNWNFL